MFYKIKNVFVAALLLPMAFGCKRENPSNPSMGEGQAANNAAHKVAVWLQSQPTQAPMGKRRAGNSLPNLSLQWQAAGYDAATHTHWIPAAPVSGNMQGGQPNTYLIATENEQGQITGGQYLMVLPNGHQASKANRAYNPISLLADKKPADFSGALLYYNVQGQLNSSQVYKAGQPQPQATANLAARDAADADPDPNYVIMECGDALGISACIDWYWQTYVNGALVFDDYMYTTCCGGNGGGGSSNDCQAGLDAMVAAGAVVSNAPIEETTVSMTNTEWVKNYSWKIFSAANTWGLLSYDKGTLEKVYYPSSNKTFWEYKAFEHTKIGEAGFTAGGTRSFADLGATINKTRYTVYEQVDFSVSNNYRLCSVTNVYNATNKFTAPNQIIYVNKQSRKAQ